MIRFTGLTVPSEFETWTTDTSFVRGPRSFSYSSKTNSPRSLIGTTRSVRLGTMLAGWLAIIVGGTLGHQLAGLADELTVKVLANRGAQGHAAANGDLDHESAEE